MPFSDGIGGYAIQIFNFNDSFLMFWGRYNRIAMNARKKGFIRRFRRLTQIIGKEYFIDRRDKGDKKLLGGNRCFIYLFRTSIEK